MKKIFSAFLLMTMMVFSVGSFVSCSDIEKEIAALDTQATENAAAIADLNSKIAALQTALNAAQADADAAQKAADAAAAAAATAKADAIAAAKAEVEAAKAAIEAGVATDLAAVNAKVASVEAALALKADKATVDLLAATLENYKATLSAEDTELWTSVSELLEALTNLQGRLDAAEMSIEDLTVAVNEAVESVKAINTSLASVYDILGVLANQIQSVVYVPDYRDDANAVHAVRFSYETSEGTQYTNFVAKMTYEVRPAKLAASITSENVSFSSVNVKAAAPQYFKGEVLSTDPTTGRVEVAVIFNDVKGDKDDYDALADWGTVAVSLNIASVDVTELLIADAQPANVDVVSSNYANVQQMGSYGLASAFRFTDGEIYSDHVNPRFTVPYNYLGTSAADKALFADYTIVVGAWNPEDGAEVFYTPEVASKLFGLDLTVTYTGKDDKGNKVAPVYSAVDVNEDEKIESPVVVTGNGLDATATLVESADYKGQAAIGESATLTLGQFKAAGVALRLSGTASYTIVAGKVDAAVVVAPITKAWSYEDETTAWSVTNFKEVELNVQTNIVDDIVELFGGHKKYVYLRYTELDKDGNETGNYASVRVYAASKNVLVADRIYPNGLLKYADTEKTYTFTGTVQDSNEVDHTVALDVVLAPMPANKTIDLGTFTVTGDVVNPQDVAVSPVAKAVEAIKAFDKEVALDKVDWTYVGKKDVDGVTLNGEAVKEADNVATLTPVVGPNEKDPKVIEDQSFVTVKAVKDYVNTIVVTRTYEICGVEYTFVATVNTEKPAIKFTANEVFVKNGVATVDGEVKLPVTKSKTSEVTGTSTAYALDAIDLRNYVHVEMPAGVKENGYELRYTLKTPLVNDKDEPLYAEDQVAPEFAEYTVVDAKRTVVGLNTLAWNLDLNELEFEIALVAMTKDENGNNIRPDRNDDGKNNAADDVVFGTVDVKLQIPNLVTFAANQTVNAKYVNGVATTANVVKALTIVDKFNNNVYNPYATTLNDMFKGYSATLYNGKVQDVTLASADFFNVYDMKVAAAEQKDVKVYLNNTEIAQSQVKFTYNQTTGAITLSEENANLTGDIKFEVPVTLTYMFDNYGKAAQKATAVVVFSQNAEAGEGTEVAFPNPAGAQWAFEMAMSAETLVNDEGQPIDEEGNVIKQEDFESFSDYMDALVVVPVKSNCVVDLTADYFTVAAEMSGSYIPVLFFTAAYKVVPTDATSGAIVLFEVDEEGVTTENVLAELPYTNYNGTTCTFDFAEANVIDVATESGVVTATVVPADEFITIGGAGWGAL